MKLLSWKSFKLILAVAGLMLSIACRAQVSWQQLPIGFNTTSRSFYVDSTDTTLYIGGEFDHVNGNYSGALVKVKRDYSVVSAPVVPGGVVVSMIRWGGKLFVGGLGGTYMYDGQTLQTIDYNGGAYCFYPYQGKLLIGGIFSFHGFGNDTSLRASVIEYDGNTFRKFKGIDSVVDKSSIVSIITEYKGDLIIAGNIEPYPPIDPRFHEILRWTGTKWDAVGNGIQGGGLNEVYSMKVMSGKLYVAGYFTEASGGPGNSITAWNGSSWDRMGGGFMDGGYVGGLESRGDTLFVSGFGYKIAGHNGYYFGAYNNGKWCINQVPIDSNSVFGKIVDFYGDLLVGGSIHRIGVDTFENLAKIAVLSNFLNPLAANNQVKSNSFLASICPNPAQDEAQVEFTLDSKQVVDLQLIDALGRTLFVKQIFGTTGQNRYVLPISAMSSGQYFVHLSYQNCHRLLKLGKL